MSVRIFCNLFLGREGSNAISKNWELYFYTRLKTSITVLLSLRTQSTFGDATTGFPAKWSLRNERRHSILMTRHYPDLGSASDWLNQIFHAARTIRSTTQITVGDASSLWNFYARFSIRLHLAEKPVVASPNDGCFLRLYVAIFVYLLLFPTPMQLGYKSHNYCLQNSTLRLCSPRNSLTL